MENVVDSSGVVFYRPVCDGSLVTSWRLYLSDISSGRKFKAPLD
jgi:hypothetical protein